MAPKQIAVLGWIRVVRMGEQLHLLKMRMNWRKKIVEENSEGVEVVRKKRGKKGTCKGKIYIVDKRPKPHGGSHLLDNVIHGHIFPKPPQQFEELDQSINCLITITVEFH